MMEIVAAFVIPLYCVWIYLGVIERRQLKAHHAAVLRGSHPPAEALATKEDPIVTLERDAGLNTFEANAELIARIDAELRAMEPPAPPRTANEQRELDAATSRLVPGSTPGLLRVEKVQKRRRPAPLYARQTPGMDSIGGEVTKLPLDEALPVRRAVRPDGEIVEFWSWGH